MSEQQVDTSNPTPTPAPVEDAPRTTADRLAAAQTAVDAVIERRDAPNPDPSAESVAPQPAPAPEPAVQATPQETESERWARLAEVDAENRRLKEQLKQAGSQPLTRENALQALQAAGMTPDELIDLALSQVPEDPAPASPEEPQASASTDPAVLQAIRELAEKVDLIQKGASNTTAVQDQLHVRHYLDHPSRAEKWPVLRALGPSAIEQVIQAGAIIRDKGGPVDWERLLTETNEMYTEQYKQANSLLAPLFAAQEQPTAAPQATPAPAARPSPTLSAGPADAATPKAPHERTTAERLAAAARVVAAQTEGQK